MVKKIQLANNKGIILVDDEDFESLNKYSWYLNRNYARTDMGDKKIYMHRLILGLKYGDGKRTDHENGNGLDNRRSNLRICTRHQNRGNQRKTSKQETSSKYKGVYGDKRNRRWIAYIHHGNHKKHLGSFNNEEDAARAYDTAAHEYFGEFARLNFPQ